MSPDSVENGLAFSEVPRPSCDCFLKPRGGFQPLDFHATKQDTSCSAWLHLVELVEEAVSDKRKEFAPFQEIHDEELRQIVTLPTSIGKLQHVRHFELYGSFLERVPPEIGRMGRLREFTPYKSHVLHWLPYEITRCRGLKASTISTKSLYGNLKYRPPFPRLPIEADTLEVIAGAHERPEVTCSVCDRPTGLSDAVQRWISLRIGTDVVPLFVLACSGGCIRALPKPPKGYVEKPHKGGIGLQQPPPEH